MRTTIKSAIAAATSMLAAIAMGDIATALDAPDLEFATSADESCAEWTEQSYPFAVGGTAARSGVCKAEDDGWMDWTSELSLYEIEGPCTLSFSYAACSPYSNSASSWSDGTFYVYVDGEEVLSKYANSDVLTWLSMFESFPDYSQQTPLKEYKITLGHGKHDEVVWSFCGYGYGISSPEEQAYAIVDNVKVTPAPESMKITFVTGDGETIAPMMVNPGKTYGELPTPNHDTLDFVGWYRDPYFVCRADDDALVSYEDQTLYARYGLPASVLDTEDLAFSADSGWFVAADAGTGGIPALTTSGKGPLIVRTCGAGTITFKEKDSYRSASLGVSEHWGEGVCWKSSYSYPLDGEGRPDWACGILIGTINVRSDKEEYVEFAVGGSYISSDDYLAQYMSAIEAGYETSEQPAFHPVLYDFEWTPAPEFQTVTFETNGGVPIESLRLSTSEPIDWSILPNPKWEDHIFCGWYRDPDLMSTIPSACEISALPIYDFTVYAKWALPISAMDTDDITFSSDSWCAYKGGADGLKAGVVSDLNCEWIEDPILEVTTRGPGTLTFAGTGSPVDVSVNGGDETSVGSYVVYVTGGWPAILIVPPVGETENKIRIRSSYYSDSRLFDFAWTPAPESMIVSFDTAGGGKVFPATRTYTPGDVFGSLPTPKRTGCRFLGWWFADDAMYTETSSRTAEADMLVPFHDFTLKAMWASEEVTILPSEFKNVEFLSWESGEEQQGRWGEIVAADGSRTLEMYTAFVGNGISFVEGEIQADVTCGGFLSFEINDSFYEAAVRISDDKGKTICERSVENVEVSESDWTKVRIAIPAGNFHIAIQGTACWFPCAMRNFVFEPLGPQESLAAWIGKLVDYKCWNEGDLARFVKNYEKRFSANAKDYEARISHAVAVLANLAESDAVKSYSNRFGLTIDYFRLRCVTNGNDAAEWPDMNELVDAAFAEAIPALASATADLMSIPEDWNGTVRLAAADYSFLDEDVAIDRADVLYARAAVESAIGLLYFAKGYDWTTNWETLRDAAGKSPADIVHNLVMDQGDFLADIRDVSALEESRDWMEAALKMALDADTAAQLRTDDVMHLVEHDPAYASVQAKARNLTQKALLSLDSTQTVDVAADIVGEDGTCDVTLLPDNGLVRVYLGALFSGRIVHDLAPTVSVERRKGKSLAVPDFYSMTDPTLAGLMPDFTAKKWTMIYDEVTNATHAVRCHSPKAGTVYSAAHFVTFFPAGADGEPEVQEFAGDSPQTLAPCGFVRPGFDFAGWATRENGAALYADGQEVPIYADLMLYALWNRALDDKTIIIDVESEYAADDDGSFSLNLSKRVLSLSTPTLTVKGLPSGLKYTAGTMTISGTATKPGRYPVTISAKSKTVKTPVAATFEIVVPNLTSRILRNLRQGTDDYEVVTCGVAFDSESVDCTPVEDGWTVKVAGLPAGLKYDAKTGKIVGVPTKAGTFTVTFTATKKGVKEVATITLTTETLPLWATGTFAGEVSFCERQPPYLPLDVADGIATLTIGANGKVSGKVTICGTNWTFSAASCSGVERLCDGLTAVEVATVMKSGKVLVPVSFRITPCEASEGVSLVNAVADCFAEMDESGDRFLQGALYRSLLKDKATSVAAKAEIEKFEGVYTVSLDGVGGNCSGYGGYLSLVIGKDGTVKASGKLVDGTAVSATSQLSYDAESLGGYGTILFAAPSTYKGGCIVIPIGFGFGCGQVFSPWAGFWESRNPLTAVGVYGDAYGECFCASPVAVGAYYDKTKKLNSYYDNLRVVMEGSPVLAYTLKRTYFKDAKKKITESSTETALAVDLSAQDGMSVSVSDKGAFVVAKATKPVQNRVTKEWFYNGVNDGALTLSFAQTTGIFKGSYTFWYDYESAVDETKDKTTMAHVSKKVSFEGIMVQGAESLRGFYLWDATGEYVDKNKTKTYKYKESHSVSLEQ